MALMGKVNAEFELVLVPDDDGMCDANHHHDIMNHDISHES